MSDIQIIKLSSGEEIIGEVTELDVEGRSLLQIEKPAVVMLMPDQEKQGNFTVGLAPYAPYAKDNKVQIIPSHVVALFLPASELLKEYKKHYGSPIITPDNQIQV